MSQWVDDFGLERARHRKFSRYCRIPLPLVESEDTFAPHSGPGRCVDSVGYVRDDHEYLLEGRKGTSCLWCLRLRRMEPYAEAE